MEFRLLGFPVRLDQTVLVLAGIILLFDLQAQRPLLASATWILVVFGSVLIHELGHALAARRWGRGPIRITLHGLGGLTHHGGTDHPWKDLVITLCGPGAGLLLGFLALGLYLGGLTTGQGGRVLELLIMVNLFWSLFNLVPVFPLDGGQALLAILRMTAPGVAWPVTLGLGFLGGLALALVGLYLSTIGLFLALFLMFIGGMILHQNWQMLKAWRQAMSAGRGPIDAAS